MSSKEEVQRHGFARGQYDLWLNQAFMGNMDRGDTVNTDTVNIDTVSAENGHNISNIRNISNIIVSGRLMGMVVHALTLNHIPQEKRISLHFKVPAGHTYFTFAEILFECPNALQGEPCLEMVNSNATIFIDEFTLPESEQEVIREKDTPPPMSLPMCQHEDYNSISDSYWELTDDLLPREKYYTFAVIDQVVSIDDRLAGSQLKFLHCRFQNSTQRRQNPPNKAANWLLIGDSQMRQYAETMESLNMTTRTYFGKDNIDISIANPGQKKFDFFNANFGLYGRPYQREPGNINEICDIVIYSFGQWPLSYSSLQEYQRIWSIELYSQVLEKDLMRLKAEVGEKRILWLTPNPHGITEPMYIENFNHPKVGNNIKDYRTSYNLRLFAEASIRVCRELNISFLDINGMANALFDLSFDGDHYNGFIAEQLSEIIFNVAMNMSMSLSII